VLLAIDIGNTNISCGLFRDEKLLKKIRFSTSLVYRKELCSTHFRKSFPQDFGEIVVCSVVPEALSRLIKVVRRCFNRVQYIVGKDFSVPIVNCYRRPSQVGQDRLVNAYAGQLMYGRPAIIVDFGTAVTFDVVSAKGAYAGGVIAPGMELALNALSEKAALLPALKLKKATSVLGKTTAESMIAGIVYGYTGLCEGILERLKKRIGRRCKVIATGGHAVFIARHTDSFQILDEDLTLKGIYLSYVNGRLRVSRRK